MKVVLFGTGAAVPGPDRDNVFLAVREGETGLLIDVGGSPAHRLLAAGWSLDQLKAVLLTHRHPDHLYGFPSLIQTLVLTERTDRLVVYGPREALDISRALLRTVRLSSADRPFPVEWGYLPAGRPGGPFALGSLVLDTIPSDHCVESVAVRISADDGARRLIYTSDTAPFPALVDLARGADVLIHEATYLARDAALARSYGHSTAAQAAEVALKAGAKKLVLVHLEGTPVADTAAFRREAEAVLGGPVTVGQDGLNFEL